MNKRDHGNNHLKKECHSCLGLLKEVDKYWNTQKKKKKQITRRKKVKKHAETKPVG